MFEKKYAEPDATWQPIDTDTFHEEIGNYWKDPVAVGIELIASPGQSIRAPFASYRYVDEETTCPRCNGTGQHQVYDSEHVTSCETCNGEGTVVPKE